MLDKLQSFADGKYDITNRDIEGVYFEQQGDVADKLDNLAITQRIASTGTYRSQATLTGSQDPPTGARCFG
jgi:amphiphysin